MIDAPETIGLVAGPFGLRLWNREEDDSEAGAIRYVRADIAASQLAEAREKLDALLAGLSAIIHCQSHLSRSEMREAAADILDEAGLKPKWLGGDQSPFLRRSIAAEVERDRLAVDVTRLREALERVLNAAGCGVDLYNDEPGREAIRTARAALASVKE